MLSHAQKKFLLLALKEEWKKTLGRDSKWKLRGTRDFSVAHSGILDSYFCSLVGSEISFAALYRFEHFKN